MVKLEGWNYIVLESVDSTNDEAKKYCLISKQKTVIRANRQTKGRGRCGRTWISNAGNLFCSLVLEFELKELGSLVMVSALSLAQTVKSFSDKIQPQIKWPNDVLLNRAKLSGILLEKGDGNYMIVGIGVNIVSAPKSEDLLYKTTSLRENGIICTAEEFLVVYLKAFNQNIELLKNGNKYDLFARWHNQAYGIGKPVIIRQDKKEEKGIFIGIDENMALLLKQGSKIKKILAGDVFFANGVKNERI